MSAPDLLVSHKDSDHDSVSASDLLMSQTGNSRGSSSASDLRTYQGAVYSKDTQGSFNIAEKRIIENLEELFNDNTVNLDETFLYSVDDRTDDVGSSLLVTQGERKDDQRTLMILFG